MTVIQRLKAADVEVHTRKDWGSLQEKAGAYERRLRTHPMPNGPALYHFLHITVTPDTDTVKHGRAGAQQVERYGLSTPPMVSYQDLVTNEGRYFEGQNYGVKGTHTVNDKKVPGYARDLNLLGYATAIMQNVWDEVTDEQVTTIAKVFAARELDGQVMRGAPVLPHNKFAWKLCPGEKAMARLEEIQRRKDQYVRDGLSEGPVKKPKAKPLAWNQKLVQVHISMKHLATPVQVAALTGQFMAVDDPHFITYTEAEDGDGRRIMRRFKDLQAARTGEYMVAWKRKRLKLLRAPRLVRLTKVYAGADAWRDFKVGIFDFEDLATGVRFRVFVFHAPSGVQLGDGWNPDNKLGHKVHDQAWPLLGKLMKESELAGFAVIAAGDTNLDLKREKWQTYIRVKSGYASAWQDREPKEGTHGAKGGRAIDTTLSNLKTRNVKVSKVARKKPFDHGGFVTVHNLKPWIKKIQK